MRRVALLALAAALAACHRPGRDRPFTLRVAVVGPLAPLAPGLTETNAMLAHDLVYEGVLYPGERGEVRSRIAREVARLGPGRFRLVLDPEARFSDGTPVAFADVARAVAATGGSARADGDGIVVEGPPATLEASLMYAIVSRDVAGRPLGTAAFRLVDQGADRIRLERVRPAPGRIARVEIVAFPSERDALAHTLRGDTNALALTDLRMAEFFDGIPNLRVVRAPSPQARGIELNDRTLGAGARRALQASLPVDELVRAACGPGDAPIPQPPGREGGAAPGRPVSVLVGDFDPLDGRLALALRRALGSGRVRIEFADIEHLMAARRTHDLAIRRFLVSPEAAAGLWWGTGGAFNTTGFSSPALDDALARGDASEILPTLQREAPVVLLCRRERGLVVDARIRNPTLSPWGILETLPDWEVGP